MHTVLEYKYLVPVPKDCSSMCGLADPPHLFDLMLDDMKYCSVDEQ